MSPSSAVLAEVVRKLMVLQAAAGSPQITIIILTFGQRRERGREGGVRRPCNIFLLEYLYVVYDLWPKDGVPLKNIHFWC